MEENNNSEAAPLGDSGNTYQITITGNTYQTTIDAFVNKRKGGKCLYCSEEDYDSCVFDEETQEVYKNEVTEFMTNNLDQSLSTTEKFKKGRYYLYRKFAHEFLGKTCEPIFTCVEIKIKKMFPSPDGKFTGFIKNKEDRPRRGADD